ncbi:MAG: MATE family efflux transporter [Lachnospiraceae bacterium]|nr:MATE family efflux transporter [Lachnospiraceae bacterium]
MNKGIKRYIGNREFYKRVLLISIPIMIQNGFTTFVNLLDNIMVGRVGTEQMSGVAISNKLIFVFEITIFGIVSGAGIFGAQFYGCGDHKGVRDTFRLKLIICTCLSGLGILLFGFCGTDLIRLFLHGGDGTGDLQRTLGYGYEYLLIMLIGNIPYSINCAYSSTLRETGETVTPMKAGIVAVLVNLVLNYALIYGHFGMPVLGVRGAAIATVISRFVELFIVVSWTHRHSVQNRFIQGVFRHFSIPASLTKKIIIKGLPLTVNELLWATGQAVLLQCYSVRGLSVIAGINIASTIGDVFNIVYMALGSSIAILVGQLLGAGKLKEAEDTAGKLIFFSTACCVLVGIVLAGVSNFFPELYKTQDVVKELAKDFMLVNACCLPIQAFMHATYFTIRSGGKTVVTFLFDSCFVWCMSIPLAFFLSSHTVLGIIMLYAMVQGAELIKCVVGYILVKKGIWIQNIVNE